MRNLRYLLPVMVGGALALLFLRPDKSFQLLGAAIDAHGGEENFDRTRTGRVKGAGSEIVAHNFPFDWEETFAWPDRLRRETTKTNFGQKATLIQLFRDRKCWTYHNGQETGVQAVKPAEMERLGDILGQLVQIRRAKAELTLLEPASPTDSPGLEVQSPDLGTIRLYFDAGRKLLNKTIKEGLDPDGKPTQVQMLCKNYRDFDGIPQPTTIQIFLGGRLVREWTILSVQFLARIEPGVFEKP